MRVSRKINVNDIPRLKKQLLHWAQQFEEVVWLDSNNYPDKYSNFDAVLAADAFTAIQTNAEATFEKLQDYQKLTSDWIFGYLSYDLKNDVENLTSGNFDGLHFPDLFFFQPKKLFLLKGNELEIQYLNMVSEEIESDLEEIFSHSEIKKIPKNSISEKGILGRISRKTYLEKVEEMLAHIHRGDIYEANFCQEFYAENAEIDPAETFEKLNHISRPPFAAFFKNHQYFVMSASPERYLQKNGTKIISQPIKGTAKRSENIGEDALLAENLKNDPKERAENIMIVDLVRNDLSKTAKKASVSVEELCAVYPFKQVHQMISTVTSELKNGISSVEVLQTTFPMGSMTGAPKVSAMKIIEELEESKRGLYSGALGYFNPEGDFDFSVIIRSILYNSERKYVSFSVGGAITAGSSPEKEYEECLLKAKAMREVLEAFKH
ncbi:MAG TPA: anthranilate synthase component I family protein [Salinimicrobium sp.]|nr:anthranilate synthase component I family protein [Salinimicrobium sp.]